MVSAFFPAVFFDSVVRFLVRVVKESLSPSLPNEEYEIHEHQETNDPDGDQILSDEVDSFVRLHNSTAEQSRYSGTDIE